MRRLFKHLTQGTPLKAVCLAIRSSQDRNHAGAGNPVVAHSRGLAYTQVLSNVSGVFRPGTATLMLGPPGAGKSTLLRVLSGQLKPSRVVTIDNHQACGLLRRQQHHANRKRGGRRSGGEGSISSAVHLAAPSFTRMSRKCGTTERPWTTSASTRRPATWIR